MMCEGHTVAQPDTVTMLWVLRDRTDRRSALDYTLIQASADPDAIADFIKEEHEIEESQMLSQLRHVHAC